MNDPLATKLKPVEVKPGISLATMTGELNVSNNKYHLDNFDDGNESKQGGGPAKRQRKEVSPSMIKSGIYLCTIIFDRELHLTLYTPNIFI